MIMHRRRSGHVPRNWQTCVPTRAPVWIQVCPVHFPSGRSADALRVTGVGDVAWVANLGSVTFHPWHALSGH
jgi:DNA primase